MKNKAYFELLSYDDPSQRQKWREICNSFDKIDIFYFPEYAKLFELHGDGKPYLFVYYESSEDLVIYPFLKRSVSELFRYQKIKNNLYDIISPYGYNGYLRNNNTINMDEFFNLFNGYCNNNNIISEFVRFHPLLNNISYSPSKVKILDERDTVVIKLDQEQDEMWSSFQPTCRNKIKKAINNNIVILQDSNFTNIDIFYKLYTDTMERLNANRYYYFSNQWFYSIIDLMKYNTVLFHAYHDKEIINSAIFIFNNIYIHYYLSGSLFEKRHLAANNLLLYEVALWAKSKGIKYFNLGGGYQPNDSLSRFKASFSPYQTKFFIGGVVHQSQYYEYLCDLRLQTGEIHQNPQYFPLYRLPQEY
jgi:serine/alanine adding enzyme